MKILSSQTVGQIAVQAKESIPVFEKYNIDYSSEGGRSLKDACYLAGAALDQVTRELEGALPVLGEWYTEEPDWSREPMVELVDYIVKNHHVYTRRQLDVIEKLMGDLEKPDFDQNPELAWVRRFFTKWSREMRDHLLEEEELVFPYLVEVERDLQRNKPIPHPFKGYNSSTHPIRILQSEHGMMGLEWKKIRELTRDFVPHSGASRAVQDLYQAFRELIKDKQKHIHLENNILFHRAEQLGLLSDERPFENRQS